MKKQLSSFLVSMETTSNIHTIHVAHLAPFNVMYMCMYMTRISTENRLVFKNATTPFFCSTCYAAADAIYSFRAA